MVQSYTKTREIQKENLFFLFFFLDKPSTECQVKRALHAFLRKEGLWKYFSVYFAPNYKITRTFVVK